MEHLKIITDIQVCSYEELDDEDRLLVDKAKEMSANAYAPYSRFHVGAALLLSNGEIVGGANQENVAFPSGTCAERSAVFYAHAKYPQAKVRKLAVAAGNEGKGFTDLPTAPCGACRQALLEYEKLAGRPIRILLYGAERTYIVNGVRDLLPLQFDEF